MTSIGTPKILVLGSGNFGSCLADHLADSSVDGGEPVLLWSRSKEVVESLNSSRRNPKYLKDHLFSEKIKAIGPELPEADVVAKMDVVLFAIPTQNLRPILQQIHGMFDPARLPLLIFVNKGIENGTQALTLEIIVDTCGIEVAKAATFLSGPSFAKEIVKRQPTQVSVSSLSTEHAERAAHVFHQPWFRCYTNKDPIGVELAGAGKNVYAIAAGISDGLGFENNTRAGLITRSLAEMTRVGRAYGASPITFLSLAGVGDLFLTCTSTNSRNYTVGYRLGKGEPLDYIIHTLGSVAEGVSTAKGYKEIIDRVAVEAPIATAIYAILYEGAVIMEEVERLLKLPRLVEHDLPPHGSRPIEDLLTKLQLTEEQALDGL